MRVLQVARYGSVKGGAEAYVAELCRGLRDAGHEVALAYASDPDPSRVEVSSGYQLRAILSAADEPSVADARAVREVLESFRPDVVHTHNVEASWLPGLIDRTAPVLTAVHDHRLDCPTGTRFWAAWDRACTVSPGAACLGYNLVAHCGSLKANATLQPFLRWRRLHRAAVDGPPIQVFSSYIADSIRRTGVRAPVSVTPYPCPQLPVAAAMTHDDERPLVFATGRVTKEKGFDLLLEALGHMQTGVHCVIAGDGHHLPALRRAATEVASRHRVDFPGWTDRATLAAWYAAAGVVVVPSAWPEPFGIVGLEAMSAGKPVVATDTGGVREWLVPDVTGLAVPPRDAAALARAIERLLADADLRTRMGEAGRSRVEQQFTLESHVNEMEEIYRQARRGWEKAA